LATPKYLREMARSAIALENALRNAADKIESLTRQLAEANKRADDGWQMFEANAAATAAATNRALLAEEQLAEVLAERERMREALEAIKDCYVLGLRTVPGLKSGMPLSRPYEIAVAALYPPRDDAPATAMRTEK